MKNYRACKEFMVIVYNVLAATLINPNHARILFQKFLLILVHVYRIRPNKCTAHNTMNLVVRTPVFGVSDQAKL